MIILQDFIIIGRLKLNTKNTKDHEGGPGKGLGLINGFYDGVCIHLLK